MFCINNAAENAWITSQIANQCWIGYTDMLPYGGGKGTQQYGSSTYTIWSAGQPNNYSNDQDYAYWSMERCNSSNHYVSTTHQYAIICQYMHDIT